MPNFIEIGETTLEKSVTKIFYTLQYSGSPGEPPRPNVISLGGGGMRRLAVANGPNIFQMLLVLKFEITIEFTPKSSTIEFTFSRGNT